MARTPRVTMEHEGSGDGTTEPIRAEDAQSAERSDDRPTLEEIAAEAYAIYLAGGATDGNDVEHWLEAERRIIAQAQGRARQSDADLQQSDRDRQQDDANERLLRDRNAAIL